VLAVATAIVSSGSARSAGAIVHSYRSALVMVVGVSVAGLAVVLAGVLRARAIASPLAVVLPAAAGGDGTAPPRAAFSPERTAQP
jgi:hypothetical protein